MRVFLTGGFGFVGSAAGRALSARGAHVVALVRRDAEAAAAEAAGWEPLRVALEDTAALAAAAAGAEAVVHAAASDAPSFLPVNRAAILAMLGGLRSGAGFVMQSGTLLFGPTPHPFDGSEPLAPPPFLAPRAALEAEAIAAAAGLRFAVVHAALVHGGPGAAIPGAMAGAARALGHVPIPPPGDQAWSSVHIEDWAALIAEAALRAPVGATRLVAAGQEVTIADFAARLGRVLGLPARPAGAEDLAALGPFGQALSLPQRFLPDRAQALLGWVPRHGDLDAGLRATLA